MGKLGKWTDATSRGWKNTETAVALREQMGKLAALLNTAEAEPNHLVEQIGQQTYALAGAMYNHAEAYRPEFARKGALSQELIILLRAAKGRVQQGQTGSGMVKDDNTQRSLTKINAAMNTLEKILKPRTSLEKVAAAYAQQQSMPTPLDRF